MPAVAVALALAAAVLHALWNLMLARSRDKDAALVVAMLSGVAVIGPVALLAGPRIGSEAMPYVVASSAFELAYFVLLAAAYRRADLSLVYPVSRGLAPVFVLLVGVALGTATTIAQVAGIVLIGLGVVLVSGVASGRARGSHLALAATIAALICGYTVVDKAGLHHADPLTYLVLVVGLPALAYAALLAHRRGLEPLRAAVTPTVVAGGIFVVGAYGLVLAALAIAPAAPVAALRETSVVVATAMAGLVLGERVTRVRLAGAAVVAAGIALVVAG
jgi:drug/metabolite transporter (DMT)-like permease